MPTELNVNSVHTKDLIDSIVILNFIVTKWTLFKLSLVGV